ncbi:MAG: RluA family pseudouridine synthase [Victivallaceae bacterium]|nr:RluA family pseudouridine synthase [Victivallaceae bacterium]
MKSNFEDLSRRVIRSSIDWSGDGLALDRYLAGRFTYRSLDEWRQRISDGEIVVNGATVAPDLTLKLHDLVEYFPGNLPEPEADLTYTVAWEDEYLLAVNKSGNLCTHPAGPFFKHTLWHLLSSRYGHIYIVNRLDRETSGLLLVAKSPEIAAKLSRPKTPYRKEYLALVNGRFDQPIRAKGFLTPDTASPVRKKRKFVTELPADRTGMESADTELLPEKIFEIGRSLVRAIPHTGRLHQIRATLFSLGFPLLGDKLYGVDDSIYLKLRSGAVTDADRDKLVLPRQALHSYCLSFIHPVTGESIKVAAPLPADFGVGFP